MHAHARIATEYRASSGGPGRSRVSVLRAQSPLLPRLTRPKEPDPWTTGVAGVARVCLAAGAAGPIGGDRYRLDVDVGAHSTLVLGEIAPSLLLPGPCGEQSLVTTTVAVRSGATLVWLPEPLIAAHGCHHRNDVRIDLAADARLLFREEMLLGRHGERPGTLHQRIHVRRDGRPLYRQELTVGPDAAGWNTPAVLGRHRAVGSLLVVDPAWVDGTPAAQPRGDEAAVLALPGPAVVITALGSDSLVLRRRLAAGLTSLQLRGDSPDSAAPAVPGSPRREGAASV